MMQEAESHADEDKKRREEIETRNQADSLVYQVEKTLRDNGDKVPARRRGADRVGDRGGEEGACRARTPTAMRTAMDELQKASHTMAEALYKQAQAGRRPGRRHRTADAAAGGRRPVEGRRARTAT